MSLIFINTIFKGREHKDLFITSLLIVLKPCILWYPFRLVLGEMHSHRKRARIRLNVYRNLGKAHLPALYEVLGGPEEWHAKKIILCHCRKLSNMSTLGKETVKHFLVFCSKALGSFLRKFTELVRLASENIPAFVVQNYPL